MPSKTEKVNSALKQLKSLCAEGAWARSTALGTGIASRSLRQGDVNNAGLALFFTGYAYGEMGIVDQAVATYELGVKIGFDGIGLLFNLANCYRTTGESMKAIYYYERILEREPDHYGSLCNLAISWEDLGDCNIADEYFRRGAEQDSEQGIATKNYSYTLLRQGDFERGWRLYEHREGKDKTTGIVQNYTYRDGGLEGKSILVSVEQGYGDIVMFGGLVPELRKKAKKVSIVADERLRGILGRSLPGTEVVSCLTKEYLESFDVRMGIASLGIECRHTSRINFEPVPPYLVASKEANAKVHEKIKTLRKNRLLVGIAWRGGSDARNKKRRSVELMSLKEILEIEDIVWVNMQYGDTHEEVTEVEKALGIRIVRICDATADLDGLIACLHAVDMVVTVQQSLVHFSGACGTKTNVLIPSVPEWRYGKEGKKMIWWDSVSLHRQKVAGDWREAILSIREEILTVKRQRLGCS